MCFGDTAGGKCPRSFVSFCLPLGLFLYGGCCCLVLLPVSDIITLTFSPRHTTALACAHSERHAHRLSFLPIVSRVCHADETLETSAAQDAVYARGGEAGGLGTDEICGVAPSVLIEQTSAARGRASLSVFNLSLSPSPSPSPSLVSVHACSLEPRAENVSR